MKYYVVAEMQVTDPTWVTPYVEAVTGMVERYGGLYLARTTAAEKLEGDRALPQVFLLVEWPSREAAMAFYDSDEYRPYRESRLAGAANELVLLPGEDVARRARMVE